MIVVVIPAVALAVMSLAAFLGRWVWWLDVLANFRAQYVVVLAVLGLLAAVTMVGAYKLQMRLGAKREAATGRTLVLPWVIVPSIRMVNGVLTLARAHSAALISAPVRAVTTAPPAPPVVALPNPIGVPLVPPPPPPDPFTEMEKS